MRDRLSDHLARQKLREGAVDERRAHIAHRLLRNSNQIRNPNFVRIATADVENLFDLYDSTFMNGRCRELLHAHKTPLTFRLSPRMTSAGGKTVMETLSNDARDLSQTRFEIVISTTLLFETFKEPFQLARVAGRRCSTRLDALQRIFEHEMVHLIEMLLWSDSSCSRERFRKIAWQSFRHRESNHQLITPADTARYKFGIRAGDRVIFQRDDRNYEGFVNRITKRATVLVRDAKGSQYSDGQRYVKFYVPVSKLRRA